MCACGPTSSNPHISPQLQPGQLERTQGWAEGDVKRGLRDTFLRLDQVFPWAPGNAALIVFPPQRFCIYSFSSRGTRTSWNYRLLLS